MWIKYFFAILSLILAVSQISYAYPENYDINSPEAKKIKITFSGGEAIVALDANPVAEEFLKLLPMDAEFRDFSNSEKIFYLPEKLKLNGGVNADQKKGDFCYFAPWGNLAIFYDGFGHGQNLYVLGTLQTGKKALAAMKNNFKARLEPITAPQAK